MLDSCLSMLCVCLSHAKKKKKENREVFLADCILFICLLSVDLDLSTLHLCNLTLLRSGWVHDALPRCPNSMHNQPRLTCLRSSIPGRVVNTPPPSPPDVLILHTNWQRKFCFSRFCYFLNSNMNKGQMHFFGNCCSVYVNVWMCLCVCGLLFWQWCGSVLLDFYFSTFRAPPLPLPLHHHTGKPPPWCCVFVLAQ